MQALIIDNDKYTLEILRNFLTKLDIETTLCPSLSEGWQTAQEGEHDLIFLDVYFPDGNGLDRLEDFLSLPHAPTIIILTGSGDPESAERALCSGAWDYITKPINAVSLRAIVRQVTTHRLQLNESSKSISVLDKTIIGQSLKIKHCKLLALQAAATNINCLILGETGTGKEIFARAIHNNSSRAEANFVTIDCANIPQPLAESIFFGHHKGAFTDARETRDGLFALSHDGTLFLDEIGDLPLTTQKSLLRVLQEKKFRPLGSKLEVTCNFRVIAATNCDLASMVEVGTFRKDLYFRLSATVISLPPLRGRGDDIELLMRHFFRKIAEDRGLSPKKLSPQLVEYFKHYTWPGNIRELINSANSALSICGNSETLDIYHMPLSFRVHIKKLSLSEDTARPDASLASDIARQNFGIYDNIPPLRHVRQSAVEDAERTYLLHLAHVENNNINKMCKISGLSRARLYELLKKYHINNV